MSAEPLVVGDVLCVGAICRSYKNIIKMADDDASRLCRIIGMIPKVWWRRDDTPEYKVRMLSFPITATRRASELQLVAWNRPPVTL